MDYKANEYDNTNCMQMQTGLKIIQLIKHYYGEEEVPIAVDIGCGSGNLTETLFKSVKINRLYGIDIDKQMVDYARDKHGMDSLTYVQADLGQDIKHNKQLDSLRGQVNFIFSNMALHWVKDQKALAMNINKLLADQGQCFMCFLYRHRTKYTLINWIFNLSPEKELKNWTELFCDYGLDVIEAKLIEETHTIDDEILRDHLEPLIWSYMQSNYYLPFTSMPRIIRRTLLWIGFKLYSNIYHATDDGTKKIHHFNVSLPFFRITKTSRNLIDDAF